VPSGYRFRIALASVAPVPLLAKEADAILANGPITEATIAEAAVAAMDACNPIDDVRGSARYRKLMVRNLTRMAVSQVYQNLTGQA
jgi:CO/xanthine dehydrogenase FAD-binding subunit